MESTIAALSFFRLGDTLQRLALNLNPEKFVKARLRRAFTNFSVLLKALIGFITLQTQTSSNTISVHFI